MKLNQLLRSRSLTTDEEEFTILSCSLVESFIASEYDTLTVISEMKSDEVEQHITNEFKFDGAVVGVKISLL